MDVEKRQTVLQNPVGWIGKTSRGAWRMNYFQHAIAKAAHDGYWEAKEHYDFTTHDYDNLPAEHQRHWLACATAVIESG
jgi:hypothetical protein